MKTFKKLIASLSLVFVMFVAVVGGYSLASSISVAAQQSAVPKTIPRTLPDTCRGNCPLIGANVPTTVNQNTIANFIIGVAQWVSIIVIALAVLYLVYGGFLFVTDNGDGKRAGNGKTILTNAIIGLVLAIVAFTIVRVISVIVSGDVAGSLVD